MTRSDKQRHNSKSYRLQLMIVSVISWFHVSFRAMLQSKSAQNHESFILVERVHYTTIFRSKVKSLPHLISRLLKQRNPNIRTATEKSRNFLKATESFTLLHCVLVALTKDPSTVGFMEAHVYCQFLLYTCSFMDIKWVQLCVFIFQVNCCCDTLFQISFLFYFISLFFVFSEAGPCFAVKC